MLRRLFGNNENTQQLPKPLPAGATAPDFELPATTGRTLRLSDLSGKPVVLVFYPADASPTCSNQLALYNEAAHLFADYDAQVVGISTDNLTSHKAFASDMGLGYPLLADDDPIGAVARAYNVYSESERISERALYVVDGSGIIRWSYVSPRAENPGAHGILKALESVTTGSTNELPKAR